MIFFVSVIDHVRQCMDTMRLNQEEDGSKKFETFLSEQPLVRIRVGFVNIPYNCRRIKFNY